MNAKRIVNWVWNGLFVISLFLCVIVFCQVFIFASFRVPSDSMTPTLRPGDQIMVVKPIYGPRLFNIFSALKGRQTPVFRISGFSTIRKNDVVVFNAPYSISKSRLEMNLFRYYVKRCQALPGDSAETMKGGAKRTIYIPRSGDTVWVDSLNQPCYQSLIEWELRLQGAQMDTMRFPGCYKFQHNYYYFKGDNSNNSFDSMQWGLLPEDFVVGKVCFVWRSQDKLPFPKKIY